MKNHLARWLIGFIILCFPFPVTALESQLLSSLETKPLNLVNLDAYKRELTISFAKTMQNKKFQKILKTQLAKHHGQISINEFFNNNSLKTRKERRFQRSISLLDRRIREAKGIQNYTSELLELRLASPNNVALNKFYGEEQTLFTYVPAGDEKDWEYIEAFDTEGNSYYLDPYQEPDQPVIIIGIDGQEDLRAGLQMVNEALQKAGLQTTSTSEKGYSETTKLDFIRLENDQEPWISGNAEIFALVNGVQPFQSEAQITAIEMPYLDKDETNYHPNQIIIFWDQYKYAAANINFFEKDDNYNYQELVGLLLEATASVMIMFPEAAPYAGLVTIANKIVQAMPDEWFTNNDDYVDVYYTIEKGKVYTKHKGASGNATMTLSPYNLIEN
ncbi:MAG: DUF3103 family protein [Desulfobacteraceae bacterium]|nr:DUF3103 family protein [Desulfobacteraceae bacterium]